MVYGIVGSRRRASALDRNQVFDLVREAPADTTFVSGGCVSGADAFVKEACSFYGHTLVEHLPVLPPKGSPYYLFVQAFFARNKLIASDSDVLYALVSSDRKGGTENTVKHAIKLGRRVVLL